MNTTIEQHHTLPFKKRLYRIIMVYLGGVTVFFLTALIIVTANVRTRQKVKIPPLVGKLYLDEHNNLMSLGLKVELKKASLLEYPYGYILSQNIAAGTVVKEGTRFTLLINQSKALVPVPNLVGISESIAMRMLASIPVGNSTYSLTTGVITRVPAEKPAGEILAQYPPASTTVIPDLPVALLISEGPEKLKMGFVMPNLQGQPVDIVKKISYDNQIPLKIVPVKSYDIKKNGLIDHIEYENNIYVNPAIPAKGKWTAFVYRYAEATDKVYSNEQLWLDLKEAGLSSKAVTIYEKSTKEDGVHYKNPAYVVLDDSLPVFYQEGLSLVVWNGYQSRESLVSLSEEKGQEKLLIVPDWEKKIKGDKI